MGYTIYTHTPITPRTVTRPGAQGGTTQIANPAQPVFPVGTTITYCPPNYSKFGPTTVLLSDPNGTATSVDIFAAFPDIRQPKAAEIRAEGARRLKALATPYLSEERETWANQQKEAAEWLADHSATVPMITAMAVERGISVEIMVGKISENVQLFLTAAGAILGEQQRLLDLVNAATDYDAMRGVSW